MSSSRGFITFIGVVISLLLTACAGSPPVPDDHYYRLATLQPEQTEGAPKLKGILKVDPVKAYGIYRERALLYSRSEHPEELQQHRYHYWIDTPSRLIRDQLVDFLRASQIAESVAGSQLPLQGDMKLKFSLKQFERVIDKSAAHRIRVTLDALLVDANGNPLLTRRYERLLTVSGSSIAASVRSFDQALSEIYEELLKDIRALSIFSSYRGKNGGAGPHRLVFHTTWQPRQGAACRARRKCPWGAPIPEIKKCPANSQCLPGFSLRQLYILAIIASPKAEQLSSVGSSIRRARS
jgi:ABC-type uncharacterized transport system auxiliary subunit